MLSINKIVNFLIPVLDVFMRRALDSSNSSDSLPFRFKVLIQGQQLGILNAKPLNMAYFKLVWHGNFKVDSQTAFWCLQKHFATVFIYLFIFFSK